MAAQQSKESEGASSQEKAKQPGKADSFSINRLLTPSEIESLRKDRKEAHEQLKGRSKHLFENL